MVLPDIRKTAEKYFNTVYRLALSRTSSISDAEDVTQDVFLKLIKSKKSFENEEHLKAWLIRVTLTCSINIHNSKKYQKSLPLSEEIIFETKEESDIYYAVSELPPKYRTVIHLHYYEDLSVKKIAEYLLLNESTVKTRLLRGRELISKILKKEGEYV